MLYAIHADDEVCFLTSGKRTASEMLDQVRFGSRAAEIRRYPQLGDAIAAQLADPAGRPLTGGDATAFTPCPAAARLLARFTGTTVKRTVDGKAVRRRG
jgi:hypothetical protein